MKNVSNYLINKHHSIIHSLSGISSSNNRAVLSLSIGKFTHKLNLYVIKEDQFKYDVLLGLDAIRLFNLIQDENLDILQRVDDQKYICIERNQEINVKKETNLIEVNLIQTDLNEEEIEKEIKTLSMDIDDNERKKVIEVIMREKDVFSRGKFKVKQYQHTEAEIKLIDDRVINLRPYRSSLSDQQEIKRQIEALLENDLIEESNSKYNSPISLVNKKDEGKSRIVVDLRELNKIVVPETEHFNRIDDIIDRLRDCEYFTVLDVSSAFWTIKLAKESREYTAFIAARQKLQWKVLPFGLKSSPAIFQRTLASVLRKDECSNNCDNYLDDIVIFSKTKDDHLKHISSIIPTLKVNNFKLKLSKCKFFRKKVNYLGHIISKNKYEPMNDNLLAIKNFPTPSSKRNIRQFNGKINFQRRFIKDCTQKLKPLTDQLKKDVKFHWSEECNSAFEQLKNELCNQPALAIFDENKECIIFSDACIKGFGAEMLQEQENGELMPIGYFSSKIKSSETRKDPIYLELLAVYKAVIYWHYYLHNRHFTVYSDHKPLKNLNLKAPVDTELGKLVNKLLQYDFTLKYIEGKNNTSADALSRNPIVLEFDDKEIFKTTNLIEVQEIIKAHSEIDEDVIKNLKLTKIKDILFKYKKGKLRVYLDKEMARNLIQETHSKFGHIGMQQMKLMLRHKYFFKEFDQLIEEFCRCCAICSKNKSRSKKYGLLSRIKANKPYQFIAIDTVGGLHSINSTKKFLHIAIDLFTRYVWVLAASNQSEKVFEKLMTKINKFDLIGTVLVDQYASLNSDKFKKFLDMHSIRIIFTPVDHADSNGTVERVNQTLINRLRCKVNTPNNKKSWAVLIEEVVHEYNNTVHTVTKFSPQVLMYGNEEIQVCNVNKQEINLDSIRETALKNIEKYFQQNKNYVDKNRSEIEFKIGDLVYVKLCNKLNRSKLDEIRSGPYEIVNKISENIYKLNTNKKKETNNNFHKNSLIPVLTTDT